MLLNLNPTSPSTETPDVVIGAPAIYAQHVRSILRPEFAVAVQNCYKVESGAFTGEIRSDCHI